MKDRIVGLEQQVAALVFELRQVEAELLAAHLEAAPVSVGDIVRNTRTGILGRVCKVEPRYMWVSVNPQKKNGEFGSAVRNWYRDWEVVE